MRGAPPGTVGDVDVGEDEAILEPEPHIPNIPDVFGLPVDVDIPVDVDVDVPAVDGVATPEIGKVPGSTAVAGALAPTDVPPPSYIADDPYISKGEVATVEHAVPLVVVGMVMVPARPVGPGLTPPDLISVEPSGIPVGEPAAMPSGEVAPTIGVGVTVPSKSPSTCAMAGLPARNAEKSPATSAIFTGFKCANPRRGRSPSSSFGARLSDIDQSLVLPRSMLGA